MTIVPRPFTTQFLQKEQVARDAYSFFFQRPKDFQFLPGQYIRLRIEHDADVRGKTRLFSLTTSPLEAEYLRITTRVIQSSFKKTLLSLIPNTQVQIFGPIGQFIFDEQNIQPLVFFAGGIGITPFMSMLSFIFDKHIQIPVTLFASFSTQQDMIYYTYLRERAQENPNVKIVYTITEPDRESTWIGETGRLSKEMISKYIVYTKEVLYYIAGPEAMVTALETVLHDMDISSLQIKKEQFSGY